MNLHIKIIQDFAQMLLLLPTVLIYFSNYKCLFIKFLLNEQLNIYSLNIHINVYSFIQKRPKGKKPVGYPPIIVLSGSKVENEPSLCL